MFALFSILVSTAPKTTSKVMFSRIEVLVVSVYVDENQISYILSFIVGRKSSWTVNLVIVTSLLCDDH